MGTLGAGAALLTAGVWAIGWLPESTAPGELLTRRATKGQFVHDVVERGELESSANVSVRCEVQSRTAGSNGVKIIEIVPEGTVVKQGDFLVKFDDAALQAERTTQQINVSSAEAAAAQSTNDLEAAIIARKEYEFGEFETEQEKIRGEILVASENASRAAGDVDFSQRLVRRGYMSRSQAAQRQVRPGQGPVGSEDRQHQAQRAGRIHPAQEALGAGRESQDLRRQAQIATKPSWRSNGKSSKCSTIKSPSASSTRPWPAR